MIWHSEYTVGVLGLTGVAGRIAVDSTQGKSGLPLLLDPTVFVMAITAVAAFVVVRERGIKNERELKRQSEVLDRLEASLETTGKQVADSILTAARETAAARIEMRNLLTPFTLRLSEVESITAALEERTAHHPERR